MLCYVCTTALFTAFNSLACTYVMWFIIKYSIDGQRATAYTALAYSVAR